jgi:hypothetical protein
MAVKAPAIVDIELVRGDSDDILVTITDDASPTPNLIDLSVATDATANRPAIIRFAVKKDPTKEANIKAAVLKLSYDASELEILPQAAPATRGQCRVKLDKPDTSDNKAGDYSWDLEVTRQDALRPGASAGALAVVAGNVVPIGTGTAFTKAKVGDVVQITSGPNDGRASLITKITSATSIETERAWEDTDPSATFEIRRGKSKTAVRGKFTLVQDVVL